MSNKTFPHRFRLATLALGLWISLWAIMPLAMASEPITVSNPAHSNLLAQITPAKITPVQPGATTVGGEGTVPGSGEKTATLTGTFIPYIVKMLFRLTTLAILVSFVVSGVMLVIAYDNEENVTKAKTMLYFSLVGFAFVTLAFAIVSAVTKINFFDLVL